MSDKKQVTNEQILREVQDIAQNLRDFMQMTSDRFDTVDERFEKVDERFDHLEGRMDNSEGELKELRSASYRHETELGKQTRLIEAAREEIHDLHSDLAEVLQRLQAIEQRLPTVTEAEVRKLQAEMQAAIDWIAKVSKVNNIPIKFPS